MRLNKISINNFGIYNGFYEYDFSVTPEKNVVLVSGRNGSGKTTLLNIVKLSIYGPKLFGSTTTQNKQYLSYILSHLNAFARHESKTNFEVGINFSMFYENGLKEFSITRSWVPSENNLKETTNISIDNTPIQDKDLAMVLDSIHRNVPKTLFELFFFDGEKINDMFTLRNDLSEMLNHVYNLNLFLSLQRDLKTYRGQISTNKELSQCEIDITTHEERLEELSSLILEIENKVLDHSAQLDILEEDLNTTKESFHASGGLNSKEQLHLKKQISDLESEKAEFESDYKSLVELLPFIMLTPQLNCIATQVKKENDAKKYEIVRTSIESSELINYLKQSINTSSISAVLEGIKAFSLLKHEDHTLYDFSTKDEVELYSLCETIKTLSHENLETCINGISKINTKLRELNTKLEESASEELREHTSLITDLSNKIGHAQTDLSNFTTQKETYQAEKSDREHTLHGLYKNRKDLHKEGNLENVIFKIETVVEEYSKRLKAKKQKEFEKTISTMFTTLIRKEDFISGIQINEVNGEIQIYNKLGGILPKENLSAGERQIYILSILFGIVTLSKNKVPLVFDTLLGRLDHTHKTHIVNSFIKNCGEQVIILATDTEIDSQYLELLKPLINNYYTIDYDSNNNTVMHHKISLS